ncbi:MATH [Macleaya cordata]|uniref:MATH n=1 Tax=Macleaya cordata TaxID=56857 RepID=A0A200PTF8_MACCD|nr:MATH [Macleaya cordata]
MAGSLSEDYGVGRLSEGGSSGQRSEALAEWRSCEQVENGTPSTSPPYWDIDDDNDFGAKPSELYGKFTWKIENFSQISKRELRSNAFEVGGYKWYILIYPQGCDVCNHLSLFLCVANHDKLLPGWSHFAQFTIAVVNKDPKKSKYSDTLHRFWKKEHDWGWKKFMELSKVLDGFIVADTLVIKAQVQVIREKVDRPFRCLDCQYRRELVRVYLTNVEQICRRFVEESRSKLGKLIEDRLRWTSFSAFWSGIDQNARRHMSREKTDVILKIVVKHFFIEKEVTSTLVMDSLYSGLKALECQSKSKKGRGKLLETEGTPALTPLVRVEKDLFVLVDDVLLLLERAALEPLPPKDEKGPQNRTKDGNSGEDFNKDSVERDERRLTELGRRTVEIFVLAHIYSTRIEVAYQEAVALRRQEELIREEEEAWQAESEQKAKRGAAEKEKRAKKKQSKHRRSSRKRKDKGGDEKSVVSVQDKQQKQDSPTEKKTTEDFSTQWTLSNLERPDTLEDVTDVSDAGDDVAEVLLPELEVENRDASPANWDADTSEVHPSTEASSSISGVPVQNGLDEKKNASVMDDSSSTCSTDSLPSVKMTRSNRRNSLPNGKSLQSPSRGNTRRGKDKSDQTGSAWKTDNQPAEPVTVTEHLDDATGSCRTAPPESQADVLSLKDQIQCLEQHLVGKEVEVFSLQKKLNVKDQVEVKGPSKQRMLAESFSSPSSPTKSPPSVQPKQVIKSTIQAEPVQVRESSSNSPKQTENAVSLRIPSPKLPAISKLEAQKPTTPLKPTVMLIEKPTGNQVSAMSRPSSAPLFPAPRPSPAIVSVSQTSPVLVRSVSAAGRLDNGSPATQSYVPQPYRNAIIGKNIGTNSSYSHSPSFSSINPSPVYSRPSPALVSSPLLSLQSSSRKDQNSVRSGLTFGSASPDVHQSQCQFLEECCPCNPPLSSDIQKLDICGGGGSGSSDEFPHLDIINDLLDEEYNITKVNPVFQSSNNYELNRNFTYPGEMATTAGEISLSINCCRYDDGMQRIYGSSSNGPFDGLRDLVPQVSLSSAAYARNEHIDGLIQSQWSPILGLRNIEDGLYPYHHQISEYSTTNNLVCRMDGSIVFRSTNGH